MLKAALEKDDCLVATVSFPRYTTPIGILLKQYFMGDIELRKEAVHMLLEADRADFCKTIVAYEKAGFDYLIFDRFTLSNLAFGVANGLDGTWLRDLQYYVPQPDLTLVMDVSAETSYKRRSQGRDKFEMDLALQNRTRKVYKSLANNLLAEGELVYVIDANEAPPEKIHQVVLSYLPMLRWED